MTLLTTSILVFLSLFAAYAKYYLSFRIGFIDLLSRMADEKSLSGLPGGLNFHYTGLRPIDLFLAACNVFFWPIFQGEALAPSLYALAFAGAIIPMWLVIVVESQRKRGPTNAIML